MSAKVTESLSFQEKVAGIRAGNKSLIYKCTKEEIIEIIKEEGLQYSSNNTIDELRKILSEQCKKITT